MTTLKDKCLEYYKLLDSNNFDEMFELFSPDITYMRGDVPINGLENFKRFYIETRNASGSHEVKEVHEINGGEIIIRGSFEGFVSGKAKMIRFVDFFYSLDRGGLIDHRKTYFGSSTEETS